MKLAEGFLLGRTSRTRGRWRIEKDIDTGRTSLLVEKVFGWSVAAAFDRNGFDFGDAHLASEILFAALNEFFLRMPVDLNEPKKRKRAAKKKGAKR